MSDETSLAIFILAIVLVIYLWPNGGGSRPRGGTT